MGNIRCFVISLYEEIACIASVNSTVFGAQ